MEQNINDWRAARTQHQHPHSDFQSTLGSKCNLGNSSNMAALYHTATSILNPSNFAPTHPMFASKKHC
jgi:hypothetical protein